MGGKVGRWMVILLGTAVLAAGLGACGGDDGDGEATATTLSLESGAAGSNNSDNSDSTDATSATDEPQPIELALGKTGWWQGTALTVDSLVAVASFGFLEVELTATFENLTDESQNMRQGTIVSDGAEIDGFWDIPTVPGKGKAEGTISFVVESDADPIDAAAVEKALANTALVFGASSDNQTKIPLAKAAKVDSVQPKALTKVGTLTHGELIVEVLSGTLAPSYEPGAKGKAALDLLIKVSCSATCRGNGNSVDRNMFSVAGPSGQSVVASDESEYCCDAIYPGDISEDPRNILRFLVPLPGTGSHTLTMRNTSIVAEGGAPGTLTFTA
ncbi:MAG: hypothetical protein ACKV2O_02075 [Acidimicrobiales bacterium]